MDSRRLLKKQEADSVDGEGGFKSLLREPAGRSERQMAHISSSPVRVAMIDTEALVARSRLLGTTGLRNYYTFQSGLQAQEIRLGSPDRFSS